MAMNPKYKLKEIIDVSSLKDIQDKFAKIVGLSTVTVDGDGTPVVTASYFTKWCSLIRSSAEGYSRCKHCDSVGGTMAMEAGKPIIYNCHTGLIDFAAPIIVNGNYLGSMLCGQVTSTGFKNKTIVDVKRLSSELNISEDDLNDALNEVPQVDYEKILVSADYLFLFSNFIAKMGIATITKSELLDETKEKMKLTELLKNMEIKALQAQINPHFLYNTLNTIARMALIEGAPDTENLIYAISDLLRYSLKNSNNMVTIDSEITNIKKYFYIQKTRFGDRFDYKLDIDPSILNFKIPVMTLQPLVENSIIHGLKNMTINGKVKIIGKNFNNSYLTLEVFDNGIGIDEDRLKTIFAVENSYENLTGLGIKNVDDRIKHFFGSKYGIELKSTKECGTTATIKVPCIKLNKREE
ncbi:PocR ligand-binding domain-containing protein [Clostridium estertheticum]|uniref:sensor histidine kinase n=1 Tax=Clostridium estertheticum TaxID=238834 RepID=UPI001C0BE193|nr:PocR ligand-binding domain-containing protein [Clostridium estertheticum]MBU3199295.1 PocR ligand-binding domain-containing protein [Clostridium estertheticum]WAG67458.1 PocR ligand-binding domain-containing protein [Clostridium estertheticum]